jgi:hypothetical protein
MPGCTTWRALSLAYACAFAVAGVLFLPHEHIFGDQTFFSALHDIFSAAPATIVALGTDELLIVVFPVLLSIACLLLPFLPSLCFLLVIRVLSVVLSAIVCTLILTDPSLFMHIIRTDKTAGYVWNESVVAFVLAAVSTVSTPKSFIVTVTGFFTCVAFHEQERPMSRWRARSLLAIGVAGLLQLVPTIPLFIEDGIIIYRGFSGDDALSRVWGISNVACWFAVMYRFARRGFYAAQSRSYAMVATCVLGNAITLIYWPLGWSGALYLDATRPSPFLEEEARVDAIRLPRFRGAPTDGGDAPSAPASRRPPRAPEAERAAREAAMRC